MTTATESLKATVVRSDEGEALWWFGGLAVIRATAAGTGGRMTIVEMTEPPNMEGPLHVHYREDEAFWVLEGSTTIQVGDEVIEAGPGDYVFGPRNVPHRYTTGDAGCRLLLICTPGGFEDLVREMSEPAGARTLPPPMETEPDWERVAAVAESHGCKLLG